MASMSTSPTSAPVPRRRWTASMAAAYEKGEAWLGYYWGPTPLLGSYDMMVH